LWMTAWFTFSLGYAWASLFIAIPAAGFLVRLFMIQHDCGHGTFFAHRQANDWIGRLIGALTLTPYDFWRRTHALHHATAGNLDRRGFGDVDTLTVHEYLARPFWGRLKYRLYRHPAVMFGIGPAYLFLLQHRLPVGLMRNGWQPWASTMLTNLAIALIVAALWCFTCSINLNTRCGNATGSGACMMLPCMAAHTMICLRCCAGLRRISAFTMCIISAAVFRITGCHAYCATTRSYATSAV
jgi:fatty acid desaturase